MKYLFNETDDDDDDDDVEKERKNFYNKINLFSFCLHLEKIE